MDTAKGHKNLPLITTSWHPECHRADSLLLGTPNNAEHFALHVPGQSLSASLSREHADPHRGFIILSKFISLCKIISANESYPHTAQNCPCVQDPA